MTRQSPLNKVQSHYIFVTGGVLSSLGKGTLAASLGAILKQVGYSVRLCKIDPYINVDPGTMNPFEHGEVFVTKDAAETDLDFGHYERFTGIHASQNDSTTTGRLFASIIEKERQGGYNGETVQIVPHFCDEVHSFITQHDSHADFIICEIGGTIGDIEGQSIVEALRQLRVRFGAAHTLFVHLVPMYFLESTGEIKTKPAQHSVRQLLGLGVQPDILCCRNRTTLSASLKTKLARACNLDPASIISARDVQHIYEVPQALEAEGLLTKIQQHFHLSHQSADMRPWENLVSVLKNAAESKNLSIGIVGKYIEFDDTYRSLKEALWHSAATLGRNLKLHWISVDDHSQESLEQELKKTSGFVVPGGFGVRGIDLKVHAASIAQQESKPFLGICLGFQALALSAAQRTKIENPLSEEFHDPKLGTPIIARLQKWHDIHGTLQNRASTSGKLRLGAFPISLQEQSLFASIYGTHNITERFRHRYALQPEYHDILESTGLRISGRSEDNIIATIEMSNHPFCVGVQFHPEFQSNPFLPHPLFTKFVQECITFEKN